MKKQNTENKKSIIIFENYKIRRHFDEKKEKWYFSVVDVCKVLTERGKKGTHHF